LAAATTTLSRRATCWRNEEEEEEERRRVEAANIGTLWRMHTYAHTYTVSNAPICSLFLINLSLRKLERAPSQTNLTTPPSPNPQPPASTFPVRPKPPSHSCPTRVTSTPWAQGQPKRPEARRPRAEQRRPRRSPWPHQCLPASPPLPLPHQPPPHLH